MTITVVLPPRNQAALNTFLQAVADPKNPLYRHYLSTSDYLDRFAPSELDYEAMTAFLTSSGMSIIGTTPNRMLLNVSAPAAVINRTFNIKLGVYHDAATNRDFFATDREPTDATDLPVWHIGGLDNFTVPKPMYAKANVTPGSVQSNTNGSGPFGSFLGSDRRAAYYGSTTFTGAGQAVGIFSLDGYNASDVNSYFTNTGQTMSPQLVNVSIMGANVGSDGDDTEQTIDIIEAISMAPGLSQVISYIAPRASFSPGSTDTSIFNKMASDNVAKQISVSWAWSNADSSSNDPIFEQMAAQGQSVFVASGDSDSYANGSFAYPAEDAYVTAVGGTNLSTNGPGGSWVSETAWGPGANSCSAGTGSGGGISPDGISIPNYQTISGVINSTNAGSTSLRNVPDVAAEANCDNYYCANGSCSTGLGGTSLAAPTWAGYLALVNQQATQNSAQQVNRTAQVGFLNPPIYDQIGTSSAYGSEFHDISTGGNGGFLAVNGYDLVTGWGSPAGASLVSALAIAGECGYLAPGHFLASGQAITSCDGRFRLSMQATDGNLVLYQNGNALWSAKTTGNQGAYATMQDDGNFVVYSASGSRLFYSNTAGSPGNYLDVQVDGNLVVYNPGRQAVWSTNTCCH